MDRRPLGREALEVSRLSLGSWRTFERIPREDALLVMGAARELGINFLDDARYDDETGSAPIPTGYSEVLFGELFRAVGWDRADTVVSNKLWWEFWPEQSAAAEIEDPRYAAARAHGGRVRALAAELGTSPSALAIAFALANPAVTSVLFGATSGAQIQENAAALEIDRATVQRLLEI